MRYSPTCSRWICLIALVSLPSASLYAQRIVDGEVSEILYYWDEDRAETSKIGTLRAVPVSTASESRDLNKLVSEFCEFVQSYLSNLPKTKPPLSMTLDDIQSGRTPAKTAVLYQVRAGGVKGAGSIPIGAFDSTAGLDTSKVYALLPLLVGYDCDLAHLAFANEKWVLQDERGKELSNIQCQSKKLERWIVEVKTVNGEVPFQESLTHAAYDAIDRLSPSKCGQLGSFRKETEAIAEERRNTPPMTQVSFGRAQANFLLKLSVR